MVILRLSFIMKLNKIYINIKKKIYINIYIFIQIQSLSTRWIIAITAYTCMI